MEVSPFSYGQHTYDFMGRAWQLVATLPPMSNELGRKWQATLLLLNGPAGAFYWGPSKADTNQFGIAKGFPRVNGADQTGASVVTDGWRANTIGILLAGDYIEIEGILMQVTADVDTDSSGGATVPVWPYLRVSPTDDAEIVLDKPKGKFRLQSGVAGKITSGAFQESFTIQAIEVL